MLDLLRVPGLGPKRARELYQKLGIASLDDLETALQAETLGPLPGFGPKLKGKILDGIALVSAFALNEVRTYGQAPNDLPNPYKIENFGQLPTGRKLGQAYGIDIDRDGDDFKNIDDNCPNRPGATGGCPEQVPAGERGALEVATGGPGVWCHRVIAATRTLWR